MKDKKLMNDKNLIGLIENFTDDLLKECEKGNYVPLLSYLEKTDPDQYSNIVSELYDLGYIEKDQIEQTCHLHFHKY